MGKLGVITYRTLEKAVEEELPVLEIDEDSSTSHGFRIRLVPNGKTKYASEAEMIRRVVPQALNRLLLDFSPLFRRRENELFEIVALILADRTYFESKSFFASRQYNHEDDASVQVNYEFITKSGKVAERGSHIMVEGVDEINMLHRLYHEWGHEMHQVLCELMFSPHDYSKYDRVMCEVFAITAGRTVGTREYDKPPHKTALALIKRLDTSQRYANKPLHRKYDFLLGYTNHEVLDKHISRKRWV